MRFSQQLTIPAGGVLNIKEVGPQAIDQQTGAQVGVNRPARYGTIVVDGPDPVAVRACVCSASGYFGRRVTEFGAPAELIVELPCELTITGPSGTEIWLEAWETFADTTRGARLGVSEDSTVTIPSWAGSVDFHPGSGPSTLQFLDDAATPIGVLRSSVVGFSVPPRAAAAILAGAGTGAFAVFRQR